MQEDKAPLCQDTCNVGGSQRENMMQVEEEKVLNVHMLFLNIGVTDQKSNE